MNTQLLNELYDKYDISNLKYGSIHDKLGDVYEEFCIIILSNKEFLSALKSGEEIDSVEFGIFKSILFKVDGLDNSSIKEISATNKVPHRATHGNAKTDVIATITLENGDEINLTISIKQSYVRKVAVAEFDANTICKEAEITNKRIIELMNKFQNAKSAKGLTKPDEQNELKELLKPFAKNLVRWAISGSPNQNPSDVACPEILVKFETVRPKDRNNICVDKGEMQFKSYSVYTVEEYVNLVMYDKKGEIKKAGFGTGLSWTYATGSGGKKIQFKA